MITHHTTRIAKCLTTITTIITIAVICGTQVPALAQSSDASPALPGNGAKAKAGAVALTPNQPAPPSDFHVIKGRVARGKVMFFEYESEADGGIYCATIHTPPEFSPDKKYPVLYLLHGASGNEHTWTQILRASAILDNLYAGKKLEPMLVVMPASVRVATRREAKELEGATFEDVLLRDLIPFVEAHYPALAEREHRALAGLSMGADTALNTGLLNTDKFAWIGAFSGGNTRRLASNSRLDLTSPERQPRLLWLSVGHRDKMMIDGTLATDAFLTEKKIPHVFRINSGGHEPRVWMTDLYHFAPMLFQTQ